MSPISPRDPVVLVHGLWMRGNEMALLRRRLQRDHGFDVHVFSYPTLFGDTAQITADLADFAEGVAAGRLVHFVGHSLGGTFVLRALERYPARFDGNAVLLAAPLNGCKAARGVLRWPMLRPIIGPHLLAEVSAPAEHHWQGPAALGAIAGTRRLGMGQFFAGFHEDHDGTVAVSETIIPGLADHLVLPHSHMGMLTAGDVADQVAHFLRHAAFRRS
ncbi:MAG TPA: alpha/beta hydrolase [Steroidobacteraceae bacterium]|nr:alpha/beta hydrolase [Steroidobacteraceae bacterium]